MAVGYLAKTKLGLKSSSVRVYEREWSKRELVESNRQDSNS